MHPKLRRQLRIFLVVYAVMTVLVLIDIIRDHIDPVWAVGGFAAGLLLGFVLQRVNVLSFDPESGNVIGRMDLIGIILLALYLVFVVFRDRLLDNWITDRNELAVATLSITAGAMIGRTLFTLRGVRGVLRAAGLMGETTTT